jgi:hypothetical protein
MCFSKQMTDLGHALLINYDSETQEKHHKTYFFNQTLKTLLCLDAILG